MIAWEHRRELVSANAIAFFAVLAGVPLPPVSTSRRTPVAALSTMLSLTIAALIVAEPGEGCVEFGYQSKPAAKSETPSAAFCAMMLLRMTLLYSEGRS